MYHALFCLRAIVVLHLCYILRREIFTKNIVTAIRWCVVVILTKPLLHPDGKVTVVGAHATRCGWEYNGEFEVGQGSVRDVLKSMQGMARCPW
jgi:hypothetical protein